MCLVRGVDLLLVHPTGIPRLSYVDCLRLGHRCPRRLIGHTRGSESRRIARMILVPCVRCAAGGGWPVYLSRTSAQDAARYYAEAIAQGLFLMRMAMETTRLCIVEPENVDLRRGQIAVPLQCDERVARALRNRM